MQRSQGVHPITLLLFALILCIINITAVAHCTATIGRLKRQVNAAQTALDQSKNQPTDEASIDILTRSTRRFADETGWLAAYQEVNTALIKLFILTGSFLTGSILWIRSPRTS